jgi:SPP1 family predicted phage head-tail adaptor
MPAGRLNRRVRFEEEVRTPDGAGGYSLAWALILEAWGGLQLERGRERVDAGRLADAIAAILTIRSSVEARGLTAANRVTIDGEPWNIRSVANEDQHNKYLSMVVEKGGAT